jgi:hypothetical protein
MGRVTGDIVLSDDAGLGYYGFEVTLATRAFTKLLVAGTASPSSRCR